MAQEENQPSADTGTKDNATASPTWDSFSGELYPFLNLNEEQKRAGYRIKFLSDRPRKETVNNFDATATDFWFDVEYEGDTRTWTISQKSLVMELQKHKPLNGKSFDIKLIPVDDKFKEKFPERFFDAGIAEQHAVTFAGGLAISGYKPVVAIYSTFLQRAYDQILHDICLQKLPVVFALDRAGFVGPDGPTPAAGPDRHVRTGNRRAVSSDMRPPFE